jgi:hypothetical protein
MLYAEPDEISSVAADITGKRFAELLYFSRVLISDCELNNDFLRLFKANFAPALQLERDANLILGLRFQTFLRISIYLA